MKNTKAKFGQPRTAANLGYERPAVEKKDEKKVKVTKKIEKSQNGINTLFESRPKNLGVGRDRLLNKRDLSRYIKWPRNVRVQRQRKILLERLHIPPAINQFNFALNKNKAAQLIRFLSAYKPESEVEKKARLLAEAKTLEEGQELNSKKPILLKYGLNHVTQLVEIKKAKLVVIAHDVDPIETVVWLPALCRRKDIPYCIVKSKSRLGQLVHQRKTCAVAIDNVRKEDQQAFEAIVKTCRELFNNNSDIRKKWGGAKLGRKAIQKKMARKQLAAKNKGESAYINL